MKHTFYTAFLLLALTATIPAFGQSDRQKQLMIKSIIEHGNALMDKQAFKEALAEYERSLQIDPENVTAKANIVLLHDNWGVYYFRHNQYQDAQMEWETAMQLNPADAKAKRNMLVLKNTLARMGLDLNTESEMIKEEKKGEQQQKTPDESSAVVILNKNKTDSENKDYVNQYYSQGNGKVSTGSNGGETKINSEESKTINSSAINAPSTTRSSANTPATNTQTVNTQAANTQTTNIQPANTDNGKSLVEEKLSRIEHKVYGHTSDELPVIKRLEKLETDNFGQVSTLPILERVQKLNELYPN